MENMENLNNAINSKDGESQDTGRQYLTFTINDNEYAVDIMKVMEIRGWTKTTTIPNSPDFMLGVINLRGLVIPIFDMKTRFSLGKTDATEKHVVIVLSVGTRTIGILVDAVSDILTITDSEIKLNPSSGDTEIDDQYVSGLISHEEKMVILLDVDFLFDKADIEAAKEKASASSE